MTDFLTKMDIKFHNRILLMQNRFARLKKKTKSGVLEVEDGFFDYAEDLKTALDSGRERIASASEIVDEWVLESKDTVKTWHLNRETKKLLQEADKAQHYAEAAMEVALAALDEADLALAHAMLNRSFVETISEYDED